MAHVSEPGRAPDEIIPALSARDAALAAGGSAGPETGTPKSPTQPAGGMPGTGEQRVSVTVPFDEGTRSTPGGIEPRSPFAGDAIANTAGESPLERSLPRMIRAGGVEPTVGEAANPRGGQTFKNGEPVGYGR